MEEQTKRQTSPEIGLSYCSQSDLNAVRYQNVETQSVEEQH